MLGPPGFRQLAALTLAALALGGCDAELPQSEPDAAGDGARREARVTKHTDGDTFWLSGIGKVRLIGVDTPEVYGGVECFGRLYSQPGDVAEMLPGVAGAECGECGDGGGVGASRSREPSGA